MKTMSSPVNASDGVRSKAPMPAPPSSRPRLGEDEALALARELYGLSATVRALPSERDQNFHLTAANGEAFVLKIARAAERREELELQNSALEWLARRDEALAVPRLRPTLQGAPIAAVRGPDGAAHHVRLLTYLPGMVLAQANPQSPALLRSFGRFLGRLTRAFAGFGHPAAVYRDLVWDPKRAPEVVDRYVQALPDSTHRRLVDGFRVHYEAVVAPRFGALRTSVIHNDANDHNVLVGPPSLDERKVVGLLDFGDVVLGPTVAELAVALAYAMLGKPDPLAAAAAVVAGFHDVSVLDEIELEALYGLACLRLCTSVCLSAYRRSIEPEDAYLSISEAPAWETLARLEPVHPRFAQYTFRHACGMAPCPSGPPLARWLQRARAHTTPVVGPDLAKGLVLDLSVGSPDLESPTQAADVEALSAIVSGRLREASADVGIGRYDEARLVYASDLFKGPSGDFQEWRTVHLGIDLFLPPGSPVYAAFAGRVHSLANNTARLDYGPTVILEHSPEGAPPFFTLYGHLSEDSLGALCPGLEVEQGRAIGRVGDADGNGGWPPHLHFQIVADLLDHAGDFPGVAPASQRQVWLSLCPDPNLVLGIPRAFLEHEGLEPKALADERRRRLGPSLSVSYRAPLKIVRGTGALLYDETGRAFLDVVNNVAHVGHSHPKVVRAVHRQMSVLNTNTRYLHDLIVRYAERLCATLPEPLRVCFFVNSGSEANELALRLAMAHTGRGDIVVVEGAYHGNTTSLVDVSPYKFGGPGGRGRPAHVRVVPAPDDYRGLYRRGDAQRGERFASHVRDAAEASAAEGRGIAAFLCESALSCAGQVVLPSGYLDIAYRHARAAGAVCIADEVQVGFGRVGTHFWGFQTQGVVPDIVTMGKPIGNGHPLGAVVTTPQVAASFANGMEFFSTFGGNPVSCAAGLAVLDVLRDEGLQGRARRVGAHFKAGLERLAQRHRILGDVRGLGLFLGIELVLDRDALTPAPAHAAYVVERMKDRGILLSTDGPHHNVVKMKPPLVFSEADADSAVAALDAVLDEDFVRLR
jgi:4-aminobutyrate aminotransferase-like enzyme/Ser/Thr protein kinase RdoA (MazF antagonist)